MALLDEIDAQQAEFRAAMEGTLRGSLGHLQLRRMHLAAARQELELASRLAKSSGNRRDHALNLNNLGIVYNHLNSFARAASCFRRAERLMKAAGEHSSMIHTACNLALIAAKLGKAGEARRHLSRATHLLRGQAGDRPQFFVETAQALTEHFLGDMVASLEGFRKSLPLGRKLGDEYLVRFGELYTAEAHLFCGQYHEASRILRRAARYRGEGVLPVLRRIHAIRLLLLDRLLGRSGAAQRAQRRLAAESRSSMELPEAWNDVFLAIASWADGRSAAEFLEGAKRTFRKFEIPAGQRFVQALQLYQAAGSRDTRRLRTCLYELDRQRDGEHKVLVVLEPLAQAEAYLVLGDLDRAGSAVREAASAIVGNPLLEFDWRLEYVRARIAEREGDRDRARHHLHRVLQVRELMLRGLPSAWRESFRSHPRFASLEELKVRLDRTSSYPTPLIEKEAAFHGIVGQADGMRRVFETVRRLRTVDLPILIRGETGTGKELIARAVHQASSRRQGPFQSLHCAALPPDLFDSELFGYEAGAFTGAEESRHGLLEHLEGGTLLLDEIIHLAPATQGKLLHVLEARRFRPVGGLETRAADVRFLASTSVDPARAVAEGRLREDLYHRLSAMELLVPALRERGDDIRLLFELFMERHARRLELEPVRIAGGAMEVLPWGFSVRTCTRGFES